MRLKRLHLQGFKTFAPKTELLLGEGLTAVVGPNGSGKSNIADAVRWALGEQSLSMLRAKKTEDLIFAGSSNRAPLGMAEVSIAVDNSDRLLPLDFAEVTLTRRAYRSGENEYYINKSRVRLREVLDVASTLGQAYTVVGQGMVDAALSLRPEERRELFEEAAAIRGYYVQREDALRRLGRTEENITRLGDLASELEPQVRRMERQARQALEHNKLEGELRALLRRWYSVRWTSATLELRHAQEAEEATALEVGARKAEAAEMTARLNDARSKVWQLVDEVSALHEQRAQIGARHAAQAQAQAVLAERLSAAALQQQALAREQADIAAALEAAGSRSGELLADIEARKSEIDALEEAGREIAQELAALDARIGEERSAHRHESERAGNLARSLTDLENRQREERRHRAEQESAASEGEAAVAALRQKLQTEEVALDEHKAALSDAQRAIADAERELAGAQAGLREGRTAAQAADERRRELGGRAQSLSTQLAALAGEQQAGLYSGVRAVANAAKEGRLQGYTGTVAELLRVPSHLETAIEAALGGRLQDVVVEKWSDAERAIAMLKETGAGRATFLPLDTIRASSTPQPPVGPGIVGLARDLVEFDESLRTLAESLLGRLLIVEDLPSARKTISNLHANSPWTLATLGGEVVRPGGSVTGGSTKPSQVAAKRKGDPQPDAFNPSQAQGQALKPSTLLGRERKRRELQAEQRGLEEEMRQAAKALEQAVAGVREQEASASRTSGLLEEARKRQLAVKMVHMEQQGAFARLQQEIAWRTGLLAEAHKTLESLDAREARSAQEREQIETAIEPVRRTLADLEGRIETLLEQRTVIANSAGADRTRLAVLTESLRNLLSKRADWDAETGGLERKLSDLRARAAAAIQDETAIARQKDEHSREVAQLASQLADIEQRVGPSEHEVRVLEAEVSRIESEQSTLQERLLESDTHYSRAAVERQRCIGVLESLQVEIGEELGDDGRWAMDDGRPAAGPELEEDDAVLAESVRSILTAGSGSVASSAPSSFVPRLSSIVEDKAELERQVYALKARISRLGPVNPLAMEEHAALVERHDFLQTQLQDLTAAAEGLRKVIGELDRTMRDQFTATFALVNEAFQHYFTTLFGGGTAKLELTNPHDMSASGVDLMAQPPGKRMQPLAALSGGERALTSAALIFALLKVRPVPFCVLDEVDAALDESNVTRFRSVLQELGARTQFVVITHNRGTIEAADTLYGVSMAGDGTSQLLSLRVEG